jgi:hypothetical protein
MTDEQAEGFQRLILIAIFCGCGLALVLNGNDIGYWFFVGVVWMLMGVL